MKFKAKLTADGERNASVQISGMLEEPRSCEYSGLKEFNKAKTGDKAFKLCEFKNHGLGLTDILFLVQEKAGLYLWWDEGKSNLILPIESRGAFRFDSRVRCPDDWNGQIWASSFKVDEPKAFFLAMGFDK